MKWEKGKRLKKVLSIDIDVPERGKATFIMPGRPIEVEKFKKVYVTGDSVFVERKDFNTLIFRNITDCVAGEDEGIWYCGREVMKSKKW